jgi:hypothetical protein
MESKKLFKNILDLLKFNSLDINYQIITIILFISILFSIIIFTKIDDTKKINKYIFTIFFIISMKLITDSLVHIIHIIY